VTFHPRRSILGKGRGGLRAGPEAPLKAPDKNEGAPLKAPDKNEGAPLKAPDKNEGAPLTARATVAQGAGARPTIGLLSLIDPVEPKNPASPKLKIPPSVAAIQ